MTSLSKTKLCLILMFCCWVKMSEGVKSGALIPCSKSDPKLVDCLLKVFPQYVSTFDKVNPSFKIAQIRDPQKLGPIISKAGENSLGLNFKVLNGLLYGQKKEVLKNLKVDLKKRELTATIYSPRFQLLGDYDMSGKMLLLPIIGNGRGNITSLDNYLDLTFKWDLVKRDGATFIKSRVYTYKMRTGKTYIQLDNLFNGDKFLGAQMNQFMNENYKEITGPLMPVFQNALTNEHKNEYDIIFNTVSYDDLFLD